MTLDASLPDYAIRSADRPPDDYPHTPAPDTYRSAPDGRTYEQRRAEFIDFVLRNPSPPNAKPVWYELVRLAAGRKPHTGLIRSALAFINERRDCSDFVLHSILRMLYQFSPDGQQYGFTPLGQIDPNLLQDARQTVLDFKYFPDEPGTDSMCTWTENHYILFTSAAYLAGQLYPKKVFSNSGETGRQKIEKNRIRILRWLALRFRTGFSEWLSHVYYDEDLAALLALHDFALDAEIRTLAKQVINLLLLDMALNSFQGVFGATHGRAYENSKKHAVHQGTVDTMKLLFGMGIYSGFDNMSAPALALSSYRVPAAIAAIAADQQSTCENRQRMGIRLAEMERWGLQASSFEDGMHLLTLEAYTHPRTIRNTLAMFDRCRWWDNAFLQDFKPYRFLLKALDTIGGLPLLARTLEWDICRNTREEVHILTRRTPYYMLSTAQDYRSGYGGDQQHIWQATLGPDAICFTTHPAKLEGSSPSYWTGSGLLPRAAQHGSLVVVVYRLRSRPALYVPVRHFYTHAWLPRDRFDEVVEQDGWFFARRGEGYLALRSQQPPFWSDRIPGNCSLSLRRDPQDLGRELIAPGRDNIWLCQLGSAAENGSFPEFMAAITQAALEFQGLSVRFASPGNGEVQFGWRGPLRVDGEEIPLHGYPRYENPCVTAPFDAAEIKVCHNARTLTIKRGEVV